MNGSTTTECPSHFALDDHEIHGEGHPAAAPHGQSCGRCQARRAERAADIASFGAQAAALWTRIAATAAERRPRRGRWRWRLAGVPALLMGLGAVSLWIAARHPDPRPAPYLAPKGHAPIEIICRRDGAVFVLPPGDQVAPGDELRFRPLPVWRDGRFIQVGSVDGTGRYTPFYPSSAGAPSVPLPPAGAALDASIRLDDAPGPERLFVVISAAPLSEAAVARTAEAQAPTGATVDRIANAPVRSAWIALPKRAAGPAAP